jgi:hypothetical protein
VRRAPFVLVAVIGALAGCGEDKEPVATPTPTAKPAKQVDSRATPEPTEQQIREAANAYLKALARRDWTAVCATLVKSEQRYFARLGDGKCERVFRASGRRMSRRERARAANSLADEIRIGRDQAVIDITESGWDDVYMRLYAIEEDGRWGIARSKKRRERFPAE